MFKEHLKKTPTYVQKSWAEQQCFDSHHDAHECLIHIHEKCIPDVDKSMFKNKVM